MAIVKLRNRICGQNYLAVTQSVSPAVKGGFELGRHKIWIARFSVSLFAK